MRGQVTDEAEGYPLIGVAVQESGTGNGVITDFDGNYELEVAGPDAVLIFSYVGKASQEVRVGRQAVISIRLVGDLQLAEVVVTGYRGAQEVKDLVGSYVEIGEEELAADRPIESLDQLIEGRVAGVRVETLTGEPGLPIRVQIRGQSSLPNTGTGISASTQPLYILDGVPLFDVLETNTTGTVFSDGNNQRLNPLALINPDDIASVTVLKDASATALYGADAANGVILITTKQGQSGQQRISLSANYGFGQTINEIQFLNTEQYLELARETLFNSGQNPELAGPSDVETNWRELVQQNPQNVDLDLALSGGNGGTTYRLTAGYSQLESVHIGNGLQQANLNLNLNIPLGERLRLSTRFSGAYQDKQGLRSFDVFSFLPNLPVRLADGSFNNDGFFINRPNPVALLEQNENYQNSFSTNAQVTLEYRPINSLKFRLLGGLDRSSRDQFQYASALNGSGRSRNGFLRLANNSNLQWITNGQLVWTPDSGSDHHFSALLGGELQRQNRFQQVSTGKDFPFDDLRRLDVLPNSETAVSESRFVRAKASLYGELSYDYDYRYYLKLNARRDASSIFGGDQQADLFWALGASWNFSQEPALVGNLPFGMDYGKLRASYGITGNSRVGVYTSAGLYTQEFSDEQYGDQIPIIVSTPVNELLGWERKRQTNFGLDLGWRDGRYGLSFEFYNNLTIDGLYTFDTPLETGFSTILANAVSLRNWGYELSLRYATQGQGRLKWSTSFNIAHNRNRLIEITQEEAPRSGANTLALIEGGNINDVYGIPFVGVDPDNGISLFRLPDGTITSDVDAAQDPRNFVRLGRAVPNFFGGWHHRFSYGAWGLTFQLNFSYGATDRIDPLTFTDGRQILINNQSVNQLDRWQQPGDITEVPRLSLDNPPVSRSSRYFYELSYIQFSTLSLDCNLAQLGLKPFGLAQLKAFALVNNLGYLYDDERVAGRNGVAEYRFTFPQQRAYTLGIKIGW